MSKPAALPERLERSAFFAAIPDFPWNRAAARIIAAENAPLGSVLASAAMPTDVHLECACGKLRGKALSVSSSTGTRVVCYCDDCQAFAQFLGRPGILDERGGTDLFQLAPSKVQLTSGTETLGCVRLSEKGMHRWYCAECKTPLGNTLGPSLPFVGMIHSFMRFDGASASCPQSVPGSPRPRCAGEGHGEPGQMGTSAFGTSSTSGQASRDAVLGPPLARVQTKFATPGVPLPSPPLATLRAIARTLRLVGVAWITRSGFPSPFFDEKTRAPRATPRILSAAERKALAGAALPS